MIPTFDGATDIIWSQIRRGDVICRDPDYCISFNGQFCFYIYEEDVVSKDQSVVKATFVDFERAKILIEFGCRIGRSSIVGSGYIDKKRNYLKLSDKEATELKTKYLFMFGDAEIKTEMNR